MGMMGLTGGSDCGGTTAEVILHVGRWRSRGKRSEKNGDGENEDGGGLVARVIGTDLQGARRRVARHAE